MPLYNPTAHNVATRDFGLKLLDAARDALITALPPDQEDAVAMAIEDLKTELSKELTPKKGRRRAASGVKRAPTAYNLFMKENLKRIGEENANLSKSDVMKLAASLWKGQQGKTTFKK
jgi:hypothetical protein